MGERGWVIAGLAALLAALAANGKAALEAVAGLPLVLQAFAKGLPFGFASFLLSLAIAVLVWWRADRHLSFGDAGSHGRDFRAENYALLAGVTVTTVQGTVRAGLEAGPLLQAVMLGILAGLLAPLLGKGVTALMKRSKA